MAGRELKFNGNLKGSTILEVLISMTVILVVFGISMMIYENVTGSSFSVVKLNAQALLKGRMLNIEQQPVVSNQTIPLGDLLIEQEIKPYTGNARLEQVHLVAWDLNHKKAAELFQIIQVP